MKKLIFLFFLASCTTYTENKENKEVLNFDEDLTFKEFNILAQKYSDINIYPDIDK